jgi:deoxyribodipyrimidine photo-lyase
MATKKIALVWFKTNLRLRDNECLVKAIAENDEVVPCYCLNEAHFQTTTFGFKKTGTFRQAFLMESLQQLDADLRIAGSGLWLLKGLPETEIPRLAKELGVQSLYAEKEVAPEEMLTAKNVKEKLSESYCSFLEIECRNLFHSADLPFAIAQLPEVFTVFRKRIENTVPIRAVFRKPITIASPPVGELNLSLFRNFIPETAKPELRSAIQFRGGADAAHERLNYYFYQSNALSTYKQTRNGMIGERYSTKFSAWLALGCISAKEIYEEVKTYEALYGANESTYWVIFELLWRDYFGFCMEKHEARYFLRSVNQLAKSTDPVRFNANLSKWINGQTGEPFVDANMLELKLTGFMSNRGRQNVASFLCNDLKLDWRYGAAYFEQQLVDYDVCNNWGNWAYLAGVGNDPRNNRYFNIGKQAATYDADGSFRRLWLNNGSSAD